jgi:hypothetical protein
MKNKYRRLKVRLALGNFVFGNAEKDKKQIGRI